MAKRRPSPALIISLIALFVALGGSVYAAAKIDGRDVRKGSLPGNRIKPDSLGGGQVNEALLGTVPEATAATTAATAATAANADNADALDGFTSAAFTRVARDGSADDAIDPGGVGGAGTAASVSVLAPRDGFLLAIASGAVQSNLAGITDAFGCVLRVNNVDQGSSRRGGELHDPRVSVGERVCATNAVVPVLQGGHLVEFNFSDLGPNTLVDEAELDVVFIPLAG